LEQSALFWHQAIEYSVAKIDVFWKTFVKVKRGKIEKWLLKYFDNFNNFTSHSMLMLSSTRKLCSKGLTLSKSNLDMMKNSSHRDEYPAMQSNGPLPQVLMDSM